MMTFLTCGAAAALLLVGGPVEYGTTRVAVVNVGAASERYLKTSALEAQFEQRRVKLNEKRKVLEDKIDRTKRSLTEEFKPGTAEYSERQKQLALSKAELQWFLESESQRVERGLAGSLREIYNDIQNVVRELAEEKKIELVLAIDQLPEEPPNTTAQARQQIVLQKVLYWHPRVDLTDEVVTRLNARYRAANPSAANPPASPSGPAGGDPPARDRGAHTKPPRQPE